MEVQSSVTAPPLRRIPMGSLADEHDLVAPNRLRGEAEESVKTLGARTCPLRFTALIVAVS